MRFSILAVSTQAIRLFVVLVVLSATSCATFIHGTKQRVNVSSVPDKATVTINGLKRGSTPLLINLQRNDFHTINIDLAGYEPYEIKLEQKFSGWVFGNILIGGLIGLVIDSVSGAIYKLEPKEVVANLTEVASNSKTTDGNLYISVVLKPEKGWTKVGQMTPTSN